MPLIAENLPPPAVKTRKHSRANKIIARRREVARLAATGESQHRIAAILGVTQPTISGDIVAIRSEWRMSAIRDFDALREAELQAMDWAEAEAAEAWQRSKEQNNDGQGDPRYMAAFVAASKARREILGLDAPVKHDTLVTNVEATPMFMGRDAMRQKVLERIQGRSSTIEHAAVIEGPVVDGSAVNDPALADHSNGHSNGHSSSHSNGNGKPPLT